MESHRSGIASAWLLPWKRPAGLDFNSARRPSSSSAGARA